MSEKFLVDTDIFIDFFKKKPWAKEFFINTSYEIYYSTITYKELLKGARGAGDEEKILRFLHFHTEIRISSEIAEKSFMLMSKYPHLKRNDSLIAATAHVKRLKLVTRNKKDFSPIKEITIAKIKELVNL